MFNLLNLAASVTLVSAAVTGKPVADTTKAVAALEIRFEAIAYPTGQIMLSLFDSEAAHDGGGEPLRVAAVPVDGERVVARITGLAAGRYAIKAFHDVDGDGQMNINPFGVPLEPFAFSNNARAEGGPARWQASSFTIAAGENAVSIAFK